MPTEKWSARPTVFGVVREPDPVSFFRLSSQQAVMNVKAPCLSSQQGSKVNRNARIAKPPTGGRHASRLLSAAGGRRERAGKEHTSESGKSPGIRTYSVAQLDEVPAIGNALAAQS